MYDLSQPNEKPGQCCKCRGTGVYQWGGSINGVPRFSGPCFSCKGSGHQTQKQIKTNHGYNWHKVRRMAW